MAKFCGKCGCKLNENGQCPNNCSFQETEVSNETSNISSKHKNIRRIITIGLIFISMIITVTVVVVFSADSSGNSKGNTQDISEAISDGSIDGKELKNLIKNEVIGSNLDDDAFIATLCNIVEKYSYPSEENRITTQQEIELIESIVGVQTANVDATNPNWDTYLFEENGLYIIFHYRQIDDYKKKRFSIFDTNNDNLYKVFITDKCFKYVKSTFEGLYDNPKNIIGFTYSTVFVDRIARKIVCGFQWTYFSDNDIQTIFGEDGNVEMYALFNRKNVYLNSHLKDVDDEYYDSLTEEHDKYLKETYGSDLGAWGV